MMSGKRIEKCGLIIAVMLIFVIGIGILIYETQSKNTLFLLDRDKRIESLSVYIFKPEDDVLYQKDIDEQNDIEKVLDVLDTIDCCDNKTVKFIYQGGWMLAFKLRYVDTVLNIYITVIGEDKILIGHDWDEMYDGIFPNVDEFWDTLNAPIREGSWEQIS